MIDAPPIQVSSSAMPVQMSSCAMPTQTSSSAMPLRLTRGLGSAVNIADDQAIYSAQSRRTNNNFSLDTTDNTESKIDTNLKLKEKGENQSRKIDVENGERGGIPEI